MNQALKLSQSVMMTPQLQQAIKLLTLTHLEMTDVISQEMVENPMLEEFGSELSKNEMREKEEERKRTEEVTAESFSGPEIVKGGKEEFDWDSYVKSFNNYSSTPRSMGEYSSGEEMPNYENMVSKGMSLAEHLEWQLRMEEFSEEEWEVIREIVFNVSNAGFLEIDKTDLYKMAKVDQDRVDELLEMIQFLDPVGCATQDSKESLYIQAKALVPRSPLVEKLILDHLEDLLKRDFDKIQKETSSDIESIKSSAMVISNFHPRPGRLVSPEETEYIVPDIYIKEVGGKFVVEVNDDGVPQLKISKLYRSLLQSGKKDKKTKEYVQEKLRSALWLIKSIENRQKTIEKVANTILKFQPEFFRKGPEHLKPMILKDVAAEIGVHESTVSRVTTNKYMHTPLGIFELKYFFNAGVGGKNGGVDIAAESLKLKIKALIDGENQKKPLSDQKIATLLKDKGIVVARRTVAKYRESMNILSSSKRKVK